MEDVSREPGAVPAHPGSPSPPAPRRGRRRASSRPALARRTRRARPSASPSASSSTQPPTRRRGGARADRRRRRAEGLPGTLGVTLLGALVPGAGFLYTGRRLLGALVLLPVLALLGGAAWYVGRDLRALLAFAVDPTRLTIAAVVLVLGLATWVAVVYLTYRQVRPPSRPRWHTAVGHGFVLVLCLAIGAPFAVAARYAQVQAGLVGTVFDDDRNESATVPTDVTEEDPWGGRERVTVLLLGGDGGEGRTGVRTDTVILLSMDTTTGRAVTVSLPRNLMNAQFPEDSPLHDLYPTGFSGPEDDGFYMLNAIYGQIPERHPGILGRSDNEGADALKQAVEGSLGVPVDYYLLVNLKGFEDVVDAIGGITVNVNEPVAIQGNTDLGIPPVDYIDPGPDQELDGFHALWFARGRYGSDDYERMDRQRCAVDAIIEAADPMTVLQRYQALAETGQEIVSTDIPRRIVPALLDLALKVKDAKVKSVVFRPSERFFSGDPDFDYMRQVVAKALEPRSRPGLGKKDPGRAEDPEDSCAYAPADGTDATGSTDTAASY